MSSFDRLDGAVRDQCVESAGAIGPMIWDAVNATKSGCYGFCAEKAHPEAWAHAANLPVMVVHGTTDPFIAKERGRRLYDAFPNPKRRWIGVDGGTQGNVLVTDMPLYAEMAGWVLDSMK